MSKRKHFHYSEWEDHKAGLYSTASFTDTQIDAAKTILGNGQKCLDAMRRVITEWPISTEQQLTDESQNRRAWLGQAACCIEAGVSDTATKQAWWKLTETDQNTANAIADTVIWEWEIGRNNQSSLFAGEPNA